MMVTTWSASLPCLRLCSCYLVLCFMVVAFAASATGWVVSSLPGFDGYLPFNLETGYVEVDEANGVELFYYFVQAESESEAETAAAPFVLWLTGGHRCSVFSGLAYEIGPIRLVVEPYNGTLPRLQEPKGYDVGDISASLQLQEFLSKWFNDHPEYLGNPFYIGGDSYAGKIVPFLAQIISEGIEEGMKAVPNLKAILEHCQGEDYANPANVLCAQSMNTFNNLISEVQTGQILLDKCVFASPEPNVNIRRIDRSDGGKILLEEVGVEQLDHPPARPASLSCFTYRYYLSYYWANDRRTRDALGIKEGTVDEWVRCHEMGDLLYNQDLKGSIKYHRNLTSRGYRALVYSGESS
nr:unnamed protein product [Digitaria exilis]